MFGILKVYFKLAKAKQILTKLFFMKDSKETLALNEIFKNLKYSSRVYLDENNHLELIINGVKFRKINEPYFYIDGSKDKFPFMKSRVINNIYSEKCKLSGELLPHRQYKSFFFEGYFYAPYIL